MLLGEGPRTSGATVRARLSELQYAAGSEVSKNDEFCIENEELCVKSEGLCVKSEEFCIKNDEFCRPPPPEDRQTYQERTCTTPRRKNCKLHHFQCKIPRF